MKILSLKLILLAFNVVFVLGGGKLTKTENERRLEVCGKTGQSKVYNGRATSWGEAPWAVGMKIGNSGVCTATLISSRHLSCATHCVYRPEELGEFWSDENDLGQKFDKSQCDKDGNIVIEEQFTSPLSLQDRSNVLKWQKPGAVGKTIGTVKRIILFGFCREATENYISQHADDFMIIELAEDVFYSPILHPACVASDTKDNDPGTVLEYFGYGRNPLVQTDRNEGIGSLRHETIRVVDSNEKGTVRGISPRFFQARSVDGRTVACPGDSGGGAMKMVDGRFTVVGVASQTTCEARNREKHALEYYAAVGFYGTAICENTGICNPPRSSAHKNNWMISLSLLFPLLLVL